jgi:Flp pilus assembly protein TadG
MRMMMKHPASHHPYRATRQRGAAALEFAVVFMLFFAVLYGILSYGYVMFYKNALNQAAAEGARAAVRLDPLNFATTAAHQTAAELLARQTVNDSLSWVPAAIPFETTVSWTNGTRSITTGGTPVTVKTKAITVKVRQLKAGQMYPLIALSLGSVGTVGHSTELAGQATSQLYQ